MSADQFWRIRPRELFNAIEGYYDQLQEEELNHWHRTRWQVYHTLSPHIKEGASFRLTDLLVLPGDDVEKQKALSEEVRKKQEEIARKWDEQMRARHQQTKLKPNA